MTIDKLREKFVRPDRGFGPTPFFAMNDGLDPDRLRRALALYAERGAAGVFMHGRTGLEVPYLSEDFFDRIGVVVEECARLGIKAWIYDEYNWPSGVAGGKVLEARPDFVMPFLDYEILKVLPDEEIRHAGTALAAFKVGDRIEDVTDQIKDGRFDPPSEFEGEVLLFSTGTMKDPTFATNNAPWVSGVNGYVDLMNPEAVETFLDLTHREYERRFKAHFGQTIPGIFTDEPQFYSGFPWTARLPEAFRERTGRDLLPLLHLLVLDREGCRRFRGEYYRTVEELYTSAYFGKLRAWCDDAGLILTGHLGMEEKLSELPCNHGGLYRPLKSLSMVGIDALGDGNPVAGGLVNMESPLFAPRAAAAMARLHGSGRVLCEAGGGAGWQATPASLKRQLDWLFASGVNFINPHQGLLSVKGLRKRDFPPSHFEQEPWFELYGRHADYIARLSGLLSAGSAAPDTALLFPQAAIRARHRGRGADNAKNMAGLLVPFEAIMEFLSAHQRDFELVFEDAAAEGLVRAEGDRLVVGELRFSLLIIPPAPVLGRAMAEVIRDYAAGGGRLIVFDAAPECDEGEADLRALLLAPLKRAQEQGRAEQFSSQAGFSQEGVAAALERLAPGPLELDGPFREHIILHRRRIDDVDLYLLANLGDSEGAVRCTIRDPRPVLERWAPVTGAHELLAQEPVEQGARAILRFRPYESIVLMAGEGDAPAVTGSNLSRLCWRQGRLCGETSEALARAEVDGSEILVEVTPPPLPLTLMPEWEVELEGPNVMVLGPWDVRTDRPRRPALQDAADEPRFTGRTRKLLRVGRAAVRIVEGVRSPAGRYRTMPYFDFGGTERMTGPASFATGIDLSRLSIYEGAAVMQRVADYLGVSTIMRTFPPAGAKYEARASFTLSHLAPDLKLIYEDLGRPVEFELNGRPLPPPGEGPAGWDPCCRAVELSGFATLGRNRLVMRGVQLDYPALPPNVHSLEPVVLEGSFALEAGKAVAINYGGGSGDLAARGFARYSGPARLTCRFNLSREFLDFGARLELHDVRECAEVWVNGQPAGARVHPPFEFDLGGQLREGENELQVRVLNTAYNLFGGPRAYGVLGPVRIVPLRRVELSTETGS